MRLSISRTLVAIFFAVGLCSAVAIAVVGQWVQGRSVETLASGESRRHAELLFQNLYSVMRKGWTKDEISELVGRINTANPDISIAVHRSPVVVQDFGEIEADRKARLEDPLIREVMENGQERLTNPGNSLRFIYPIVASEECLSCHTSAQIGSINGVIDIRIPVEKLRIPLDYALHSIIIVFGIVALILFFITLAIVRYTVAKPMHQLAEVIDSLVQSGDLSQRVDGRSYRWLFEVRSLAENFNRLMTQLEGSQNELMRQSTTDPLTGLSNRRQFNDILTREFERASRHEESMAVIMIDLDGFKPINDRYGHATGDTVLRRASAAMVHNVRMNDCVARLGGDEFAVLAPNTDSAGALILGKKLVAAIEGEEVIVSGDRVTVGASIGIAAYPLDGKTLEDVLQAADDAMYANKRERKAGR